ncbi:MAG: UDP-N-acetylmuramoyl-L-alanyl-D-glutamate--2,6-diaminopimelate ligase [Acidobacteria bacterium RIFCSPLOWO2_12_FULL_67_14]|nr:MAG: UDP-N-acetylmuramoyl-L-alanyl-D-glutamate--2,6-diaminopimelate ligase [Acidobacteria bacterium RIFCSPLOWO2_02_FULL_67_21]OFW35413.1 MAG: UDP-N-acetylmuramoyl-L-alanyl-D-glutamate--2,6-diaminopimelate ligase [Acidobacteria bacterium RIFCSPLOWO2_12_FULL_67_14]
MTVRELLERLARALPPDARPEFAALGRALDVPCLAVTHDSRRVKPGWAFVAVRGLKSDGTDFVPQAAAAGAAVIVAERPPTDPSTVPWVVVQDARLALAWMAAELAGHPSRSMRVVGVTGTNGKTTTSYLVNAIFEAAGVRCGLMGTVTYRLPGREFTAARTTPEAPELQDMLREMADGGCGACVMEVSSHALALRRADAVHFAAGVFTNLTRDHLDFHADMEDYFAAKRRLFELLPRDAPAVVNIDDPRGSLLGDLAGRLVSYAVNRPADVTPGPVAFSLDGLEFDVRTPGETIHIRSTLVGRPNVYNILAAAAVTTALGVPAEAVTRGVSSLQGVPGRFEKVSSPADDITVIVDYAHTDDALRNLLEMARPLAARRLITVFGAGGDRDRTKRPLMGMVAARLSDVVVITSDNPRSEDPERIIDEVHRGAQAEARQQGADVVTMADRRHAILHGVRLAEAGDLVVVAGKGHEKYQEIAGESFPFDDVAVAREALDERRRRVRVG